MSPRKSVPAPAAARAPGPAHSGAAAPRRIHIIGGPGSGKTSLAERLGRQTGLPVHHLDEVARVGGGNGPERTEAERTRLVAEILASDGWVTEGLHLRWTDALLERADLIVWLDHVSWRRASRHMLGRFVSGAWQEARRRRLRHRFTRFRDYGRHLRWLGSAIVGARYYYHTDPSASPPAGAAERGESRAETEARLASYSAKLRHCRVPGDVAAVLESLA
jgi:hypothetical protein